MQKQYKIEKDIYLNCWIIWQRLTKNAQLDIYHAKTKKECKQWLSTL